MKVVLFCGGLGTRLREYTGEIPKPMVKIGYRPILWHLMKYYAHFGHTDFVLCLGYRADVIKEFFLHYEEWISNDFTLSKGGRDLHLENNDIEDWNITFVDTGLHANIGERLVAVRKYVRGRGGLPRQLQRRPDRPRPERDDRGASGPATWSPRSSPSRRRRASTSSTSTAEGQVASIHPVNQSDMLINAGFFVFRQEVFDYIEPGDELVVAPFHRLIKERKLHGYRYDRFWCMDTFKEQQQLSDLYSSGRAPWEVWKGEPTGALERTPR